MLAIGNRWGGMRIVTTCVGLGAAIACSSPDLNGPASADLSQLPWILTLSAHAITMDTAAPYDTLQLTAAVRTVYGTQLPSTAAVTFATNDSSVRVSANGLLTARAVRNNVQVVASVLYNGVQIADTAIVNVTGLGAPPVFRRLLLQLMPGDSAKIAAPNLAAGRYGFPQRKTLQIGALDALGNPIANSLVALRSSDVLQAGLSTFGGSDHAETTDNTVDVYIPQSSRIGVSATIYGGATVYGKSLQDSVKFVVTNQLMLIYTLRATPGTGTFGTGSTNTTFVLLPNTQQAIGVGGYVWWVNTTSDSLDIVFDDPTVASPDNVGYPSGAGNIAPFPGGDILNAQDPGLYIRARRFLHAGMFHFHSIRAGIEGVVIVQ